MLKDFHIEKIRNFKHLMLHLKQLTQWKRVEVLKYRMKFILKNRKAQLLVRKRLENPNRAVKNSIIFSIIPGED